VIKAGMGVFMTKSFESYQKIYGAVASVPVFLLWVFLGWVSALLGASLASSISAFRYQPVALRLPEGYELYGLLRMLGRFAQSRKEGNGLHSDDILHAEPMLTDDLVQQILAELCGIGLLKRGEDGAWLLARDLDDLTLAELYEACQLRIPIAEAHLPCREDALGVAAISALDDLRLPLRELLKRRVAGIFDHSAKGTP
jgi:membrane protein